MRRAVLNQFGSLASYRYGEETYDATKLGLGPLMGQFNGAGPEDNFAGPLQIALGRPMEASTAIPGIYPWAYQWQVSANSKIDWVFLADNAAAAATRRIIAYEFNRITGILSWKGYITLTYPTATTHTIRGFRMTYDLYTTGTVAVSGTAVTGTGSTWTTDRLAVGSRIGFGSTDPTQITTWYEISAIGTDTSITLTASAGTISSGTAYVIEDLRAVTLTTNATATNGGVFIAKGLRYENFTSGGTTIPAATTVDNIRAVYWLKDAATITNTAGNGCGIEAKTSWQSQMFYSGNGTTTMQLFKYNLRAALTLTSGADTTAFQFATAVSATLSGTASQANNGRLATPSHGPGSGVSCYYFTTTTRVYRTKAVSTITTGDTTFLSSGDVMLEVPPGGVNTFAASAVMNSLEYMSSIDKFFICVNATTTPFRSYITQYRTDSGQFDRIIGTDVRQINQSGADATTTPVPTMIAAPYSVWCEGGIAYIATIGALATSNFLYVVPVGADWEYASSTGCRIISPKMSTSDAAKFVSAFAEEMQVVGGQSGSNLGMSTEPWRLYYRTAGISDNSGSWVLLDQTGIMGVAGTTEIQFMFEFRTIGLTCVPSRIGNYGLVYDDTNTDDHWQFAAGVGTDLTNKRFGFRHAVAYGSSVPRLRIDLFDAESGSSLGTDDSTTQAWTWEKSTDNGGTWGSYNTTDRANANTYIRVTPTSLADNIKVRAVLRLY